MITNIFISNNTGNKQSKFSNEIEISKTLPDYI